MNKKYLFSIIIVFLIGLMSYQLLNMILRTNITFENLKLNNTNFKLYEKYKENNVDKYIYKSEEGVKLYVYKLAAYAPPKGKPFSNEMNNLYKNINYKNKKLEVLEDYYHHIFILDNKNESSDFESYFNDYKTIIYCNVKKNKKIDLGYNFLLPEKDIFKNKCKNIDDKNKIIWYN